MSFVRELKKYTSRFSLAWFGFQGGQMMQPLDTYGERIALI